MEAKLVCLCYFKFDFMIIKIQNKIIHAKVEFVRMAVILKRISAEKNVVFLLVQSFGKKVP